MAETVSEIRLRIAALLDKGEFAAAQSEMAKLKDAVDDIQEAQEESSKASEDAADSAKQAHYLPAIIGVQAWFGTTSQCIDAACTGRGSGT